MTGVRIKWDNTYEQVQKNCQISKCSLSVNRHHHHPNLKQNRSSTSGRNKAIPKSLFASLYKTTQCAGQVWDALGPGPCRLHPHLFPVRGEGGVLENRTAGLEWPLLLSLASTSFPHSHFVIQREEGSYHTDVSQRVTCQSITPHNSIKRWDL